METVRGILAAHPGGISRAGILAWAQLRIDPDFDQARLDAELTALGAELVERDGFLWLSSSEGAPQPAPGPMPWEGSSAETSDTGAGAAAGAGSAVPAAPDAWRQPAWSGRLGPEDGIEGWRAPDGTPETSPASPAWQGDDGSAASTVPGWTSAPARRTTRAGGWIFGLVVGAIILISNLAGFVGGLGSDATPVPTGPRPSVVGSTGPVEDLSVGDCIAIPTAAEFSELVFVACDTPHDAEVFFVGDHPGPGDAFPDAGGFESWVEDTCWPAFEAYTGSAVDEQSALLVGWFTPTESSWQSGDRTVHCYLAPSDGTTTSISWRGANP